MRKEDVRINISHSGNGKILSLMAIHLPTEKVVWLNIPIHVSYHKARKEILRLLQDLVSGKTDN